MAHAPTNPHRRLHASRLAGTPAFLRILTREAYLTAKSAADQTGHALKRRRFAPNLQKQVAELIANVKRVVGTTAHEIVDRVERAHGLRKDADDEEDWLGDITRSAVSAVSSLFGRAWSALVGESHKQAGVNYYIWTSLHDNQVRPEHLELDGSVCDWEDPPLTADKSSNEEDDHPGEDYNCRCVASPITEEELLDL